MFQVVDPKPSSRRVPTKPTLPGLLLRLLAAVGLLCGATAAQADSFYSITPCRVFDTRTPADTPAMQGQVSRFIPIVGGSCPIPAEATAISVNFTVTNATAGGDMEIGAGDASLPAAAAARVSFQPNRTRANNGIVQLATDGVGGVVKGLRGRATSSAGTSVDLIIDINGFFLGTPVAVDDAYDAVINTALNVSAPGVLQNDILNGGAIVSYGAATGSEQTTIGAATPTSGGGSVTLNADGSFAFTPATGFLGSDTFKYVLQNSSGTSTATVTFDVKKNAQTITFTSTAPAAAQVGGPTYNVTATASSGLTVALTIDPSASSVCSISGSTVTFIGVGTCVIDANQPGDANYAAAPQVQQSFAVAKGDQTISFTSTAPVGASVGGPTYNVTATATSGLTVALTIDPSSAAVCSLSGSTVSFIGVGTCVIDANQPGDANWNAAPQVQQSFAVGKGDQTITFTSTAPSNATIGGPTYTVTATASSGLAVTFSIDASATSVCSISGATVSFLAQGTCVIDANQAGDANWNAAPQAQQSFAVSKVAQTITFTSTAPAAAKVGGPTYNVTATASSGLTVTFTIDAAATSVCSISGSTVSFIGVGTCVIDADQAGDATYAAAPQVQQSFGVTKNDQTITFTSTAPVGAQVGGPTYNVTATASSGLTVAFTIDATATSVCSLSGSTVSFIGVGTCVIDANQAGDANYNPAPQVQQSFTVAKGDQTISFTSTAPVGAKVGGPTYTVTATATSGLPVTLTIDASAAGVCSLSGSTVSFIGAGTCVIDGNQGGNASYNAAPQAQQSFTVAKGDQTVSFTSTAPVGAKVGGPTYTVTATSTSGLTVALTIDASATSVCSISGSTVTFIGAGTCVIDANQAGNANYNAAPQVQQSFAVAKGDQTISFTSTAPVGATVGDPPYTVTATATSGLPVTFTIDASATSVCSISGSSVSLIGGGTCVINANQPGNANYNAAPQVQQSFIVAKKDQAISFTSTPPAPAKISPPTYTVTATATSGLAVTFTIDATSASVCSIVGSTVTFNTGGTCVIDANQAGNGAYNPAPQVQQSVTVNFPPTLVPSPKENFDTIGNTQLEFKATQAITPSVFVSGNLVANFTDPDGPSPLSAIAVVAGATANGGKVDIATNGEFTFTPKIGDTAASDSFGYQVTDGLYTISRTVTVNRKTRVWYVKNDSPALGTGGSGDPFDTLAEAQTASSNGDYIFVYFGDGLNTGQNVGIVLKDQQHLLGEFAGLSIPLSTNGVNPTVLLAVPSATACSGGPCKPVVDSAAAITIDASPTGAGNQRLPAEIVGFSLGNSNPTGDVISLIQSSGYGVTASCAIKDNTFRQSTRDSMRLRPNGSGGFTQTFTITGNDWLNGSCGGDGVGLITQSAATNVVVNASNNTNLQTTSGSGAGLRLDVGSGGTLTITGLADNTVNGDSAGTGITSQSPIFDATPGGTFQTVSGGNTVIGASGNPVGSFGLVLNNASGALNFPSLQVYSGGVGVFVKGTGAFNSSTGMSISAGLNAITVDATNGAALDLESTSADLQFASLKSTSSSTTGVRLVSVGDYLSPVSPSIITAPSGSSITNATGIDFTIDGGNATVTYAGTISDATGRLVSVVNTTGDTKSFSGAITDSSSGTGQGIVLTSNTGATINFSGAISLSTGGNAAFTATGGGTVSATDTTSTIVTTTGTALNVANTTIGSGGLKFKSISAGTAASGPANGIVLNNTGSSGSLSVLGTGSATSGGTIQKTTGDGISLTNTLSPSFTRMLIKDTGGDGIGGTAVTNFTLTNSTIDNSGTALGAEAANIGFNTTAAGTENNLSGTVTITGNTLTNAYYHGVDIFNFNGTIADANISSNTITSSSSTTTSKGTGVRLVAFGSATTVANVTKAEIANNIISNFPSANGILASGGNGNASGPAGVFGTAGSGTNIIAITGNRVAGFSPAVKIGAFAIAATVNGKGQGNFDISNNGTVANPITNVIGAAISNSSLGNAVVTTTITNNVIVANNQAGAQGIGAGTSQTFGASDTPSLTVTITGNNVSQTDGNGILVTARDATGTVRAKIQNNTVAAPLAGNRNGIRVDAGNAVSVNDSVCLNISGNTSAGVGLSPEGIGLRKQGTVAATNNFALHGFATSPANQAQTAAYSTSQNPGSASGTLIISGDNFNSPTCSFP